MADHLTLGQHWERARAQRMAQAIRELKFHKDASHIAPDYRDGWNQAIETVAKLLEAHPPSGVEGRKP